MLARYFDVETDISSTIAKKEFTALAYEVLDKRNSLQFNQAIMEFGALQCMPKNPNCSVCVLNDSCVALQKNKINKLPVKLKKTKMTERFFNYLVFEDEHGNSIIQQRTEKGIWHNLYEFPLIESFIEFTEKEITDEINKMKFFSNEIMSINAYEEKSVLHILSHQRLKIRFWNIQLKGKLENAKSKQSIKKRPFPIVIFNFIEKYF